jgi:1,3-beta-glucanosyltransferase GAS1
MLSSMTVTGLFSMTVTGLLVAALGLVNAVSAISTLSVVGSKFFTEEGDQFYIKGTKDFQLRDQLELTITSLGVAYQLTTHDPLIDNQQCTLDAALMKELGANTIRVYHVDPSGDHKDCMDTFANAGIYLFVDLDDFPTQISQVSGGQDLPRDQLLTRP